MNYITTHQKPPLSFPSVSGSIVTFNSQYAGLPLKSHKIALTATQSGSGTPSPDNVRTINGVSAIHIQNTAGINQWDEVWENGIINSTTGENEPNSAYIRSKNYIRINPNTNYFYKTSATLRLVYYDANKAFVGIANANNTIALSPANAYYVRFYPNTSSYGSTYKNDISINFPATDTSYHAFVGQSVTIQIGSTVYGGEYDARTGVLTVTHISVDWKNLTWTLITSGTYPTFQAQFLGYIASNTEIVLWSDIYEGIPFVGGSTYRNTNYSYKMNYTSSGNFMVQHPEITNETDFVDYLKDHTLVMVLATPQTIQLPPCPIDTLEGVNNIWADTGDTEISYIKLG